MLIAVIVLGVASAAGAGLALWLYAGRAPLLAERDRTAGELLESRKRADLLDQENRDLLHQVTSAQATVEQMREQHAEAQKQAREAFASLASESLNRASEQFLSLATEKLGGEKKLAVEQMEQRHKAVEAMLDPIRKALEQQAKAVGELEAKREGAYQGLRQQLTGLMEAQQGLSAQTSSLKEALRGSHQARGRWGELTLRRIAELAGMVEHCDFDEQVTIWRGGQNQRPDMVIRLPSDRVVVVDSKGIGANYLAAVEAVDEPSRRQFLALHARDIETQVTSLSRKAYTQSLEAACDFVVLFMPAESFLSPAIELKPDLLAWAMNQGVVIATPTILVSLLRVVEMGWREQKIAENARHIRDLGVELHSRTAVALNKVNDLGKSIDGVVKSYNALVGSVERNFLPQARRFAELGAGSKNEVPGEIQPVENAVRQTTAAELAGE